MKGEAPRGWLWRVAWAVGFAMFPYVTVLGSAHRPVKVPSWLWFTVLLFVPGFIVDWVVLSFVSAPVGFAVYYAGAVLIAVGLRLRQRSVRAAG